MRKCESAKRMSTGKKQKREEGHEGDSESGRDKMDSDLKILLQQRKLNAAVPALEAKIGVEGLETLVLLEDTELNVMVKEHGLPLMTGEQKRELAEVILKMLPRDASYAKLEGAIGDIVHDKVRGLDLQHQNISDEGVKALAEALKVNTALQELYLFANKIPRPWSC